MVVKPGDSIRVICHCVHVTKCYDSLYLQIFSLYYHNSKLWPTISNSTNSKTSIWTAIRNSTNSKTPISTVTLVIFTL